MKFQSTSLPGLMVVELEPRVDERGFLARTFCEKEFAAQGLNTRWPQCNLTLTRQRGMVRGLHYQAAPQPETKLVRCASGAVFDVVVDVRNESATFGKWEAFELTEQNGRMLYVPGGFAHGFQCLTDDCRLFYMMSEFYEPDLARGLRWDDPSVGIEWPISDPQLSERDQCLPLLTELERQ